MSDALIIRRAEPTDAEIIARIEQVCFATGPELFSLKKIRAMLQNPRVATAVAEIGVRAVGEDVIPGRVVGWAAGLAWTRGREPWGRIYALAVDPVARGRHIGQSLVERMIVELAMRGARTFYLEVNVSNAAAIRLYERMEFQTCARLENFYGKGVDALRMLRAIPIA